jgi:hypothetical protein
MSEANNQQPEGPPPGERQTIDPAAFDAEGRQIYFPTPAQGTPTRVYIPMEDKQRRRITMYVTIVAVAFIIIPFLFWRGTWFGRQLPDADLEQYLNDAAQPRHVQHALVQISERIERGDKSVERWYPQVAALASHAVPELRVTLAFVLGSDPRSELFHETLGKLLADSDVLVQRNAALSLVRFNDPAGLEVIRGMFQPTVVKSTASGTVRYRAQMDSGVEGGTVIARIEQGPETSVNVATPLPGKVLEIKIPDGSPVSEGDELMTLSPGEAHVWEALRALTVIGQPRDLELLAQFERFGSAELTENFRQQARVAAAQIRLRAAAPAP